MFFTVICSCVIFIIFLVFYTIQQKIKFRQMKSIPGPPSYPIIGCVLEFDYNIEATLLKDVTRLLDIYGRPNDYVIKVDVALNMHVCIANPELAEFFLSSPKYIKKHKEYDLLRPWIRNGLLTSSEKYWQQRRKTLTTAFHFKILEQFIPILNAGSDKLVSVISKKHNNNNMIDIFPLVTAFTLDVICETAMGTSMHVQDDPDSQYLKAVKTICRIALNRTFSIWKKSPLLFPLSKDYKIQKHHIGVTDQFTKHVIDNRRKNINTNITNISVEDDIGVKKKQAFLDLLLNCTIDGKPLSDEDIIEEVNTFLFAGHDTSSSAISFALYSLAQNKDVQEKVYQEINEVIDPDENYQPTLADLNKLKYMELVIKETLRMYPPVPIFGRELLEDVTYKDMTFLKGCSLHINVLYMQRRPDLFENPEKFQPERFLEKKTTNIFSYVPFSAGPRNCIGQKLAMHIMKIVLLKLVRNFEFSVVDENLFLFYELILKSKDGIRLKIRKRN